MPPASPKRRALRAKPRLPWRILSWAAGVLALLAISVTIANTRWDVTWRVTGSIMAGTRAGALKIFRDWHGDPNQGFRLEHRTTDAEWAGRWLWDPSLGWFEFPLWLAIALALIPLLVIWHAGLQLRARRRTRRVASWGLTVLCAAAIAGILISTWRKATLTQGDALIRLSRASLYFEVQYANKRLSISGSPQTEWVATTAARPIFLPTWTDSGTHYKVDLPLWIPALALGALALALRRLGRFDARMLPGHCPQCGYDRKGLSDDAKCPECGHAATPHNPTGTIETPIKETAHA